MFKLVRENSTVAAKAVVITQYLEEIESAYSFYALSESVESFVNEEFSGDDESAAILHIRETFEVIQEYEIWLKSKIIGLVESI